MWAGFLFLFMLFGAICDAAIAVSLHVGNSVIPLSTQKNTSPALATVVNGTRYFGALFSDTPPHGVLRVNFGNTEYWLGEYCAPGTYMSMESGRCTDCGPGHYCMGGHHRAACSGGIIGCPGMTAATDVAVPTFVNRILSADEFDENAPLTDLAGQWRQISCCVDSGDYYETLHKDYSAVNYLQGCANGTLAPGTYMFTARSKACPGLTDPFSGDTGAYVVQLAIFDHAVSYKTFHASSVFLHFVDVDTPEFTEWDYRIPNKSFCSIEVPSNISGLESVPRQLCVYELR